MHTSLYLGSIMAIVLPVSAALADGKTTYDSACQACHAAGVAGAPKLGDVAAWKDRIGQGLDTLVEHSIKGFQGDAGMMPPKGGFANLSDDEVKAAVAYLVESSK